MQTKIDKIDLYIAPSSESAIFGLSSNSDVILYDKQTRIIYNAHLSQTLGCRYHIVQDVETSHTLAFILINWHKSKGAILRKDTFETTGLGHLLRDISFYWSFIEKLNLNVVGIKRLDLCQDYPYDQNFFTTIFRNLQNGGITTTPFLGKSHGIETIYIGARKNNQYKIIRIYNKVLDSIIKGKANLYGFERNTNMVRIEIELRKEICKKIDYQSIKHPKILHELYIEHLQLKRNFGHVPQKIKDKYKDFYQQTQKKIIDYKKIEKNEYFKTKTDELKAYSTTVSYISKFIQNGYELDDFFQALKENVKINIAKKF